MDSRFSSRHAIGPTWDTLLELEPRLALIEHALWIVPDAELRSRGIDIIWQRFKPAMTALVGWERIDGPRLLNSDLAYQTAYSRLYGILESRTERAA